MGAPTDRNSRIRGLDGVRGLAALGVFVHHKILPGTYLGPACVSVFFVLSGYLIIGILMRSRHSVENGTSSTRRELVRFWMRRSLRVFPAYYLLLFTVPLLWTLLGESGKEPGFSWYLCYTQNFYIGFIGEKWGRITHLWSLAIEEQFYLLSAPLFLLLPSRYHRKAAVLFVMTSAVCLALMTLTNTPVMQTRMSPVVNFGLMGCGAYLAWIDAQGKLKKIDRSWLLAAIMLLGLATYAYRLFPDPEAVLGAFPAFFVFSLLGSSTLLSYVIANPTSIAVRMLECKPLRYLGTISYSVYLYHYVIPDPDRVGLKKLLSPDVSERAHHWISSALMLLATLGIASISWHLFEKPLISLKDRFGGDSKPVRAECEQETPLAADPVIVAPSPYIPA